MTSPGITYKDMIIVGSRLSEGPLTPPGHIRAYDVHTGKRRWIFHTIPHPDEFGYDTWSPEAWKTTGGANCWGGLCLDHDRGLVFLGTGYDKRMPRVVRELAGTLGLQRVEVTRQYRVAIDEPTDAAVYLQGVNEETHGIADSLLSVVAQRSADIVQDILERQSNGVGAQFSAFSVTKESA